MITEETGGHLADVGEPRLLVAASSEFDDARRGADLDSDRSQEYVVTEGARLAKNGGTWQSQTNKGADGLEKKLVQFIIDQMAQGFMTS